MSFRLLIYNALVNKKPGIKIRYHKIHDGSRGLLKVWSWIYLLALNFGYYVLQLKFLGRNENTKAYESKRLPAGMAESEIARKDMEFKNVNEMTDILSEYDAVSFDMFDTLIFRPLSDPSDVFFFVGEKLGIPDFKNIRMQAGFQARQKKKLKEGHTEVTLREIWDELESVTGVEAESGMQTEIETEENLCLANPFMLEVWNALRAKGKRIVVVSDMYMSSEDLEDILLKNGFEGAQKIYVSCEYCMNKAKGDLFDLVKKELGAASVIHVGDNPVSDGVNAKKAGFSVCRYPRINRKTPHYRPCDMSAMVGSAYRGIVAEHIYNGAKTYSPEYEYGFIYGGLFVLGYCCFIHEQAEKLDADKIFFLSRDGYVLKKIYNRLFPGEDTEYIYWSRRAALLLTADDSRYDYFRRFVFHKTGQNYTIKEILDSMDLGFLAEKLHTWSDVWKGYAESEKNEKIEKKYEEKYAPLDPGDKLTVKNAQQLKLFIEHYWDDVIKAYSAGHETAKDYFGEKIGLAENILVVDIGWAGSGALSLSRLIEKVWNLPCRIRGIVAGTNTMHSAEPDASEAFLQSGKLISYMYSQSHNRDLLKKHDPDKDHNIYWEMLLSSPELPFSGFYHEGLRFGKQDVSDEVVRNIGLGIDDFVTVYTNAFKDYPYMYRISGRDAYAPMMVAMSFGGKYLKTLAAKIGFEKNVV